MYVPQLTLPSTSSMIFSRLRRWKVVRIHPMRRYPTSHPALFIVYALALIQSHDSFDLTSLNARFDGITFRRCQCGVVCGQLCKYLSYTSQVISPAASHTWLMYTNPLLTSYQYPTNTQGQKYWYQNGPMWSIGCFVSTRRSSWFVICRQIQNVTSIT